MTRFEPATYSLKVALPTELHPLEIIKIRGEKDSNLRRRKSTDLQSVPVGRFGIPPKNTLLQYPCEKGLQKYTYFPLFQIFKLNKFENT